MRRPSSPETFCLLVAVVIAAVLAGALLRMPSPVGPTRVVYVNVGR